MEKGKRKATPDQTDSGSNGADDDMDINESGPVRNVLFSLYIGDLVTSNGSMFTLTLTLSIHRGMLLVQKDRKRRRSSGLLRLFRPISFQTPLGHCLLEMTKTKMEM